VVKLLKGGERKKVKGKRLKMKIDYTLRKPFAFQLSPTIENLSPLTFQLSP